MTGLIGLLVIGAIVWFVWKTMYRDNAKTTTQGENILVQKWKASPIVVKGLLILFGLGVIANVLEEKKNPPPQASAPPQVSEKFKQMPPGEHLINAKKSIESKNYDAAKTHLEAIQKNASEYSQVAALQQEISEKQKKQEAENKVTSDDNKLKEMEKRTNDLRSKMKKYYANADDVKQAIQDVAVLTIAKEAYSTRKNETGKRIYSKTASLLPKVQTALRDAYASSVEEIFVRTGMDAQVRATGDNKKTLRIKYALMSQPLVYKFQNEIHIDEQARAAGFTKLLYTNGFESSLGRTWTVNLK